jgi:ribosomal protein S18 acetylase RimI-like enzyme
MSYTVVECGPKCLAEYGTIPISFRVDSILRVEELGGGLGGLGLREEAVGGPYLKDYDALGEQVTDWPERFDVSNWLFLLAREGGRAIGGATVACRTPGLDMLQGRTDLAALWDIRVHPDHRRRGVGQALFEHATGWARERGCTQLKIETQNNNVRACRFYAAQGSRLGAIVKHAYTAPEVAEEAMLLWWVELRPR